MEGNMPIRVELTEDEMRQATAAASKTRGIAETLADRLASPGEREDVGPRIDPATADVFFVYA